MERFDKKGMLIIPNPSDREFVRQPAVLVVERLFCPEGHSLMSRRVLFNGRPGIVLAVKEGKNTGLIALSPVYGEKCRVTLDLNLTEGSVAELSCPQCATELPRFGPCECGGDLITLFLTEEKSDADCAVICNRIGCPKSKLIASNEVLTGAFLESL
ncbi:MAG: hypothetical protein JW884_02505 [Deltaproteobacteria bacterium]|nr:hypothetical protein [Deltaproteobacteria bacterium]